MFRNCFIAGAKAHVADLAFPEVLENTVRPVSVRVSVLESLFARYDDHQGVFGRRYDSSLLLPAKARVNIEPPIVHSANFESPRHLSPPLLAMRLARPLLLRPFDVRSLIDEVSAHIHFGVPAKEKAEWSMASEGG
jgi:hypothetical protein